MINIAKILKNAPQGLKLYSLVHGEVTLDDVADEYPEEDYSISVNTKDNDCETFTKYGEMYCDFDDTECVLFPSKEHKSWDNWQEVLFQVGDIVINQNKEMSIIIKKYDNTFTLQNSVLTISNVVINTYRYATQEEREQFFKELNDNGYYWNENTKQVGKSPLTNTPKYKVGDWIKRLTPDNKEKKYFLLKVTEINDVSYQLENIYGNRYYKEKTFVEDETYWELATEQELIDAGIKERPFTIDSFKPFDKVLVRDNHDSMWEIELFMRYDTNIKYSCLTCAWRYCVPYNDETKHLLGTTDDCPDKYKTWQ